ncbi:MAG: hypothetical protein NC350_04945 [Corallococcus sp.]|nr:hypothetical protein [Corallococcus sp.]
MRFGKAFGLSATCWKLMVKTVVCQVLLIALVIALCLLIVGGLFETVMTAVNEIRFAEAVETVVDGIKSGNFNGDILGQAADILLQDFGKVLEQLPQLFGRMELAYLMLILIYVACRMLVASSDIAVYCSLGEFMTTNYIRPFTWYFVKKLGKSFRFVLLQAVTAILLDFVIIFSTVGFSLLLLPFGSWTFVPALVLGIALYAMRLTLLSLWAPSIVMENVGVGKGLGNGFASVTKCFWSVYVKTFAVVCVMAIVTVGANWLLPSAITAAVTAAIDLIAFYLLKCVNMVEYFESKQLPYFYKKLKMFGLEEVEKKYAK